jgi:hypothetical protein
VNYDKIPAVDEIFKTPHFRQLDAHNLSCYWMKIQEAESLVREHGDRGNHDLIRSLTEKDISVITRFSVPMVSDPSANTAGLGGEEDEVDRIRKIQSRDQRIAAYRALYSGGGSSSRSIETLVSCYETLYLFTRCRPPHCRLREFPRRFQISSLRHVQVEIFER